MNEFIDANQIPKVIQDEINNLSKVKAETKTLQNKNSLKSEGFITEIDKNCKAKTNSNTTNIIP